MQGEIVNFFDFLENFDINYTVIPLLSCFSPSQETPIITEKGSSSRKMQKNDASWILGSKVCLENGKEEGM